MDSFKAWKKRQAEYKVAYNEGKDDGFKEGVNIAIKVNLYQFAQYLGDKRGWNRYSIFRALRWMEKHANMMLENYMSFDGVMNQVKEDYGIVWHDGQFFLLTDAELERIQKNVS